VSFLLLFIFSIKKANNGCFSTKFFSHLNNRKNSQINCKQNKQEFHREETINSLLKNDSNKFRTASGVFSANKNASQNAFFKRDGGERERERERKRERERGRERKREREREIQRKNERSRNTKKTNTVLAVSALKKYYS
jgi:hypothetical protein